MKKMINGLLYDTREATPIASHRDWEIGLFGGWTETKELYLTKKGRFFLHTHLNETCWFDYSNKEDIVPFSEQEAQQFILDYRPEVFNCIKWTKVKKA